MMFTSIILLAMIFLAFWYYGTNKGLLSFGKKKNDTAMGVLKQRFANDEISEEEYKEHKVLLEDGD